MKSRMSFWPSSHIPTPTLHSCTQCPLLAKSESISPCSNAGAWNNSLKAERGWEKANLGSILSSLSLLNNFLEIWFTPYNSVNSVTIIYSQFPLSWPLDQKEVLSSPGSLSLSVYFLSTRELCTFLRNSWRPVIFPDPSEGMFHSVVLVTATSSV